LGGKKEGFWEEGREGASLSLPPKIRFGFREGFLPLWTKGEGYLEPLLGGKRI